MPPPDWNTKAGFDAVYWRGCEPDGHPWGRPRVRLGYSRWTVERDAAAAAAFYASVAAVTDSLLVIGSGFPYSLRELRDTHGLDPLLMTGVDTSSYVQGAKDETEETDIRAAITAVGLDPDDPAHVHPVTGEVGRGKVLFDRLFDGLTRSDGLRVLDETLRNPGSRNRVVSAVGGSVDWIFTEQMLESLTDSEVLVASQDAHSTDPGAVIYHLVADRMRQAQVDQWDWNIKTLEDWKLLVPADFFVSVLDWRVV